jgi:AraC-like DNA-binding protein
MAHGKHSGRRGIVRAKQSRRCAAVLHIDAIPCLCYNEVMNVPARPTPAKRQRPRGKHADLSRGTRYHFRFEQHTDARSREEWYAISNVADPLLPVDALYWGRSAWAPEEGVDDTRPDNYSLNVVQEGTATLRIGDAAYALRPGCVFLLPPGAHTQCLVTGHTLFRRTFVVLRPTAATLLGFMGLGNTQCVTFSDTQAQHARMILARLEAVAFAEMADSRYIMSGIVYELLTVVARAARMARKEKYIPEHLECALWQVRRALHEPWTVAKMARVVGCSVVHCNRLCKEHLGMHAHEWIELTRVQHASSILMHTNATVQSISARAGFDDPYYFSTVFKRVLGVSPSEFRRRHLRDLAG